MSPQSALKGPQRLASPQLWKRPSTRAASCGVVVSAVVLKGCWKAGSVRCRLAEASSQLDDGVFGKFGKMLHAKRGGKIKEFVSPSVEEEAEKNIDD